MTPPKGVRNPIARPDGLCHAATADRIVHGCGQPALDGRWSCAAHRERLEQRAAELIEANRRNR